jgi:hypothetical protein
VARLLLMLSDQVYVDEGSPGVRERIRATRDTSEPPGEEVGSFEEYTWLYHESWGDSTIRWLLSTIPTAMVLDDHDMVDDWNISRLWKEEMGILDASRGDPDHLLFATTDPVLLAPGLHYAEAWNEAVCDGAWGGWAAALGEKLRRAADFDHWAAFQSSFKKIQRLLRDIGRGEGGAHRPRSSCSPVMSTTPTWQRPPSQQARTSKAPSTKRSARRSGMPSMPTSGRCSASR